MPYRSNFMALCLSLCLTWIAVSGCKSKVHTLGTPPDPTGKMDEKALKLTDNDRKAIAIAIKRDLELYLVEPPNYPREKLKDIQIQEFNNLRALAEFAYTLPLAMITGYVLDLTEKKPGDFRVKGEQGDLVTQAGYLVGLGLYGVAYSKHRKLTRDKIVSALVMPLLGSAGLYILAEGYEFPDGEKFLVSDLVTGSGNKAVLIKDSNGATRQVSPIDGMSLALAGVVIQWPALGLEPREINELVLLGKISRSVRELSESL